MATHPRRIPVRAYIYCGCGAVGLLYVETSFLLPLIFWTDCLEVSLSTLPTWSKTLDHIALRVLSIRPWKPTMRSLCFLECLSVDSMLAQLLKGLLP